MSSTANMMRRMPSVFAGAFLRLSADRPRRAELHQLEPAVAMRGAHHGDVDADVVEPDDSVHPRSRDWHLALQLHAKFGEERNSSLEVLTMPTLSIC